MDAIVAIEGVHQRQRDVEVIGDDEPGADVEGYEAGGAGIEGRARPVVGDANAVDRLAQRQYAIPKLGDRLAGRAEEVVRRAEPPVAAWQEIRRDQPALEEICDVAAASGRANPLVGDVTTAQALLGAAHRRARLDPRHTGIRLE